MSRGLSAFKDAAAPAEGCEAIGLDPERLRVHSRESPAQGSSGLTVAPDPADRLNPIEVPLKDWRSDATRVLEAHGWPRLE